MRRGATLPRSLAGHLSATVTAMVVTVGLSGPVAPVTAASATANKPGVGSTPSALVAVTNPTGANRTVPAGRGSTALPADDEAEGEQAWPPHSS